MADEPQGVPPRTADANKLIDQTQPAALRVLEDRALGALLKDLRAMKAQEADRDLQKLLAGAIRRAADERHARAGHKGQAPDAAAAGEGGDDETPSAARVPGTAILKDKLSKAEKAEARARKEAEKAEKRRVRDAEKAEKAERKAARAAGAGAGAKAGDKEARKAARTGEAKPPRAGKGGKGKEKGQGKARAATQAPPPVDEPAPEGGTGGEGW